MRYVVGLSSLSKVRKLFFSVSEGGKGLCFCCAFCPLLEKGILNYIAHPPIIQVFTVYRTRGLRYPAQPDFSDLITQYHSSVPYQISFHTSSTCRYRCRAVRRTLKQPLFPPKVQCLYRYSNSFLEVLARCDPRLTPNNTSNAGL